MGDNGGHSSGNGNGARTVLVSENGTDHAADDVGLDGSSTVKPVHRRGTHAPVDDHERGSRAETAMLDLLIATPPAPSLATSTARTRTASRVALVTGVSTRRVVAVVVLVAAVCAAIAVTASAIDSADARTYSAVLMPAGSVSLTFSQTGELASIAVRPGQHVKAGQLLATEQAGTIASAVELAKTAVADDQIRLSALQSLEKAAAGAANDARLAAETAALHAQIQAGENLLSATTTDSAAADQDYRSAVSADQNAVNAAQSAVNAECPGGRPANTSTPQAQCAVLSSNLARAQGQLADEVAADAEQEATTAELKATAERSIAAAQANLQTLSSGQAVASASYIGQQIDATQAQLASERAALSTYESAAAATVLRAPASGVVESVGGEPGEPVGPEGVRLSPLADPTVPVDPGLQLFPVSGSLQSAAATNTVAVVTLQTAPGWDVTAMVPQQSVDSLHIGERATFAPSAFGGRPLHCRVVSVDPTPIEVQDTVHYSVLLAILDPVPSGALPGMSGTVSVG